MKGIFKNEFILLGVVFIITTIITGSILTGVLVPVLDSTNKSTEKTKHVTDNQKEFIPSNGQPDKKTSAYTYLKREVSSNPITVNDFVTQAVNFSLIKDIKDKAIRLYFFNTSTDNPVHDGDTFRASISASTNSNTKYRLVAFDTPEIHDEKLKGDNYKYGGNDKTRWQIYFGQKATKFVRDIVLNNNKYNVYSTTALEKTDRHGRTLGFIYIDLVETNEIELYSLADIVIRRGYAIPSRPDRNNHFDIGLNDIAPEERELQIAFTDSFLYAYTNKKGFFDKDEWVYRGTPFENKRKYYPENWSTKEEWSQKLMESVYHDIGWWKSANRAQNEKYCTLDTLPDKEICKEKK